MNSSNDIWRCQDHNELVVFLARSISEQKTIRLCHKCVIDKKKDLTLKNLILIDDAKKYLQETKAGILEERESLNKYNIGILNDIKDSIGNLSLNFNLLIDKIKVNIDSGIKTIEESSIKFQKELNDISFDQIENTNMEKSSILYQLINQKELYDIIQSQIGNLFNIQLLQKCQQLVQSLKVGEQSETLNQLSNIGSFIDQQTQIKADWICDKHEQEIVFADLSQQKSIQNRLACLECVPEYQIQYTNLGQLQQKWQKYTEQALKLFNFQQSNTQSKQTQLILQLKEFREIFLKIFEQLIQSIQNKVALENNDLHYHHKLFQKTWQALSKNDLINIVELLSSQNRLALVNQLIEQEFQSKDQAIYATIYAQMQQLQNLINSTCLQVISSNMKSFATNEKVNQNKINIESQIQKSLSLSSLILTLSLQLNKQITPQIFKPFTYEIVSQISESIKCKAFAFNNDSSILIAGQDDGSIKVFEFNQGKLKEVQLLKEHSNYIQSLYFMQRSSSFISAGNDKQIIVWRMNNQKEWQSYQKLEGHTDRINCLIMNNKEDCIISGSNDTTIKFWVQENQQWKCNQTLLDHKGYIRCLSLNISQNMLISCGQDKLLLIIQQNNNNKIWNTIQKISVERQGYSLCFITDQMFTFQPYSINIMHIYQLNTKSQQFIKIEQEVSINSGSGCSQFFPQKFIKEKQILLNKNGQNVNLIRLHGNGQFKTEQSIQNKGDCCGLFGIISNDGSYLVTYESQSKEIKVRIYREK
ncbi:unnamed protein product (macronuclear) [Paramecium tetraurelia]|uniref:Anaphase-promoting complex subunit 4 WD40 domain-containing protein n=1 Tax=Paramecium tetraurelia TaxID=5888 RepID=A0BWG2_PARTE|nr:uncharacterized protein GSPATT00032731001 [Paramecium tetraurelia]CAK62879.1 unnamed protein product [Paramecium tetraurelia]|eukprot:XP_001430277.1 hypothetical protein (macronuclear) [Paramecium tetraurelia strain d4-2]